ncbi:imm11 family protein [Shimia sp. MIT1388]|uniref:imm11 family protein n=1 Tax=Shimia sp. MIT1388 TaxID=3096992 RepID=UPI00399B49F5
MAHEKVWDSCFLSDPEAGVYVSFHLPGPDGEACSLEQTVDLAQRYRHVSPGNIPNSPQDIRVEEYPDYMYPTYREGVSPDQMRDVFKGKNGLVVISGAMFDLLQKFNLGATRLKAIPLREIDQATPVDGRWYFVHFRENRNCLVPEKSTGVEPTHNDHRWRIETDEKYRLCVDPSSAGDLDLWRDSRATDVVFLTDRLKEAIEEAGLVIKGDSKFRECFLD